MEGILQKREPHIVYTKDRWGAPVPPLPEAMRIRLQTITLLWLFLISVRVRAQWRAGFPTGRSYEPIGRSGQSERQV